VEKVDRDLFPVVVHVLFRRARQDAAEFLLLRRAHTGFMDGWYSLPGGHLERGESVIEAAKRECREEVGVEPVTIAPLAVLGYRSRGHQGFNFVFGCDRWTGELRICEPVFDEIGWYAPDALPALHAAWLDDLFGMAQGGEWLRELTYG
jgi:8-oxo-dGTP diphosphatase